MAAEEHASQVASQLAAELERSRQDLMDAITGLSEEGFRQRREPSEWTPAEVLTHLFLEEARLAGVVRQALDGEGIAIDTAADDALDPAAREAAKRMPVPHIVHGLLARRRETLALLESPSPAALERAVQHPAYGEVAVSRLVRHIADHEIEHAGQIRALRRDAVPAGP